MLILWTDFCKLQKLVFLFIKKDLTLTFKRYIISILNKQLKVILC